MADENVSGSEEVTIDDIEAQIEREKAPAPTTLSGDDVPDEFKGKTAKEVIEEARRAKEALRISEDSRLKALEEAVNRAPAAAPAAPSAPEKPAQMTEEEFDALYETNPREALRMFAEQRESVMEQNLLARLAPLAQGAASSAEQNAKQKYATEFELFKDEIEQIKKTIPNPAFLSNPVGWDQVIAYIRGRDGNFEKIIEHRSKASTEAAAAAARNAQISMAGSSIRGTVSPAAPGAGDPSHHGLDETERRVADTLRMSYVEYAKWKRA